MKFRKLKIYTVEYCINNQIAIHCKNPQEFVTVGRMLIKHGLTYGMDGYIQAGEYPSHYKEVCLHPQGNLTVFGHGDKQYFEEAGTTVINFRDFMNSNVKQKRKKVSIKTH